MVSRKKAAGKARKKAKAKAEEEAQQQAPEAQTQQFIRSAPIAGNDSTTMKCGHGLNDLPSLPDNCYKFYTAFRNAYFDAHKDGVEGILECLAMARSATIDKFADVWKDSAKMEIAMSIFLSMGVQDILKGSYNVARVSAGIIRYFADYIAVYLKQTQALMNYPKIHEAYLAELHTLVKFYRRRIPCSCLEKTYEQVKTMTKMGACYGPKCPSNGQVERSKTFYCSRCRCSATYCSRECQRSAWRTHQTVCDHNAVVVAKFQAKQQQQ